MADRIEFTLVENAFDYLDHASVHAQEDTSRDWKYSILHTASAVELFLKARLQEEHPSLICQNIDTGSERLLASGEFVSVSYRKLPDRLHDWARVDICSGDRETLKKLGDYRNCIQHFNVAVTREQVLPILAKGFDFCIRFVREKLMRDVIYEAWENHLQKITENLTGFSVFVQNRLDTIGDKIQKAYVVVSCPQCLQDSVELGNGEPICHFCGHTPTPYELCCHVAAEECPDDCPECGESSCAYIHAGGMNFHWLCFSCGISGEYDHCVRCGGLHSDGGSHCSGCWDILMDD
jgi:hypothetical protein